MFACTKRNEGWANRNQVRARSPSISNTSRHSHSFEYRTALRIPSTQLRKNRHYSHHDWNEVAAPSATPSTMMASSRQSDDAVVPIYLNEQFPRLKLLAILAGWQVIPTVPHYQVYQTTLPPMSRHGVSRGYLTHAWY
jgi:hypothetical protein